MGGRELTTGRPSRLARARTSRRAALADEAFETLRADLLAGGPLTTGRRLIADDLARRLGMSRTPVREALHRLSQRGVLTALESGGYERRRFRTRDVRDLYEIRRILEPFAARLAAAGGGAPVVSVGPGFHAAVAQASGNRALAHVIELLRERVDAIRIETHVGSPGEPHDAVRPRTRSGAHAQIGEAIARGDAGAAQRAMDRHLAAEARSILRRRDHLRETSGHPEARP